RLLGYCCRFCRRGMPVFDCLLLLVLAVGRLEHQHVAPAEEFCKIVSRPCVAGYAYLSTLARRPNDLTRDDLLAFVGYVMSVLQLAVHLSLGYPQSLCLLDIKSAWPVKLFKAVSKGRDRMR